LFQNVLKKFFTNLTKNENKVATNREVPMSTLSELLSAATRTRHTLINDTVGAAALVVILVTGLHLPSLI
jgi:hypothetical protein